MMVSLFQFSMVTYGGIMHGLCPTLTVKTASAQYVYNVYSDFEFFIPIWLGGSLVCDTIITVYMTIILRQEGAKSSFQSTKSLTTKLIKLAIETGLVTTLAAVIELILATAMSQTVWHLAIFYTISKLYANCVLANLNSRKSFREDGHSTFPSSFQANTNNSGFITNKRPRVMEIMKTMETDIEMDSSLEHEHSGPLAYGCSTDH
ncbi:hypothetical protein BJ138DRAFT_493527 [Hygrophoropsis aurantiaca]|uniref:Uncharacterized protein n=1 Tax=Hygrophoropsis aurantiaca TaxID=72124 RepID=A0ACB8A3I9_9AGAM|nr:hypothetical protein BJ138DRAFT_493527 [Hygrophoropsis aurantiaca]